MSQYQWAFNAETGAFKNHALSRDLYVAAVENSTFMDHVQPIEAFGRKMGESVLLTRIRRLTEPTTGDLTEGIRIPEDDYAMSTTSITVTEIGRAVPYTSLSDDLTFYDLENTIQNELMKQMMLVLDTKAATAFQAGQIKYDITGMTTGTFSTGGSFSNTSTENLNTYHVEEIYDYLYDDLYAEPAVDDDYICITRTLGYRGIKRDPSWEEWHKYTDPSSKYNGEVGRWENVRFIKTNHSNALAEVGTGSVLGESVIFGKDAVAMAEVQTPELRAAMPGDYGRDKGIAWYGILEFGVIWDTANAGEAKIVHVGSA
jgi:N4-gp56 family major capsid protein